MIPPTATHQQKKVAVTKTGKQIHYEPSNVKQARSKYMAALVQHKPEQKLTGPLRMVTKWIWPKRKEHTNGRWKDTKPDTDNIIKLFKDCVSKVGFFDDDCQIASETVEKFWGNTPGIWVHIEELT